MQTKFERVLSKAYVAKSGRRGKECDLRYSDNYEEYILTLRGWVHSKIYMPCRMRWVTVRAHLRYYVPIIFGKPTQEDCIYELYVNPIKTTIVAVLSRTSKESKLPYDFNCPRCHHSRWQGMVLEYTITPERYYVQCMSIKCAWHTPYFRTEKEALDCFRKPSKKVRTTFA